MSLAVDHFYMHVFHDLIDGRISNKLTAQKMKFFIKDFFSKCEQIRRKRRIWSHLLKKSLMKNFVVCAVLVMNYFYLFLCIKCYKFLNFYAINLHQVIYTTKHYESQSFLKSQPYLPKACLRKFF